MSITDELREWLDEYGCEYGSEKFIAGSFGSIGQDRLLAIADRIDERYSVKVERLEKYRAAVDAMLKEYVKLPVDADGNPVRVGDRMAFEDGEEFDVIGISDSTLFYVDDDFADAAAWTQAGNKHHVKPDSWECIITDALKFAGNGGVPAGARFADYAEEFVERCKRLAGGAE